MDLWLANWEQQCAEHLESEPDCEGQLHAERDRAIHNNWLLFQNTATSIAQLYKGIHFHHNVSAVLESIETSFLPCCSTSSSIDLFLVCLLFQIVSRVFPYGYPFKQLPVPSPHYTKVINLRRHWFSNPSVEVYFYCLPVI